MNKFQNISNQELLTELDKRLTRFTFDEYKTLVSVFATENWKPLILYVKKPTKKDRK